jgi:hypothetical protein
MLFERYFRLKTATLAITEVNGKQKLRFVEAGSLLKVISRCGNTPNAMVDVWVDGEIVEMFAVDVRDRSDEVRSASTAA